MAIALRRHWLNELLAWFAVGMLLAFGLSTAAHAEMPVQYGTPMAAMMPSNSAILASMQVPVSTTVIAQAQPAAYQPEVIRAQAAPAIAQAPAPAAASAQLAAAADASGEMAGLFQITLDQAQDAVAKALQTAGAGDKVKAMIAGKQAPVIYAGNKPIDITVKTLHFDESGRWTANFLLVSNGQVLSAIPASGRFEKQVEVPILTRRMRNDEIISAKDITTQTISALRLRGDMAVKSEDLIGKSPRTGISPNRPIRLSELVEPTLIKKGALVHMRYRSGRMEISAVGEAMEDGVKGGLVRVRNQDSKRIIQASVQDRDWVEITSALSPIAEPVKTAQALTSETLPDSHVLPQTSANVPNLRLMPPVLSQVQENTNVIAQE